MSAWTEIVDYTVPSNTTSVVLNDFGTITKDDFIKVVATIVNSTGSTNIISIYANTATTATNYHRQLLEGSGSSVAAARTNASTFDAINANKTSTTVAYVKLSENDRFNVFANNTQANDADIRTVFIYTTSSGATFTSGIDTLTFTSNQTSGIGTDSRIQIYRLDAEKVADITTTANATQVDISSLSIGKDSEYLLVSDLKLTGGPNFVGLCVNGNTTLTNYNSQIIRGNGSTESSGRSNSPSFGGGGTGNSLNSLIYSHIKLSEIGAYTSQNYSIEFVGTSSVQVANRFLSSTAENITSITQLNVIAGSGVTMQTGTRFILYKLK